MLALMTELEKQGPHFAAKMLITVLGMKVVQLLLSAPLLAYPVCVTRQRLVQHCGWCLVPRRAWPGMHPLVSQGALHASACKAAACYQQMKCKAAACSAGMAVMGCSLQLVGGDDRGLVYQTDVEVSVLAAIR